MMQYGCIGYPLSHSYSKEIHAMLGDYLYELTEIEPADLAAFFRKRAFHGINVTIPYKQAVISYLDVLDPLAESVGAVNTVLNRNGKLYGYNTDVFGLTSLIRRTGQDLKDKKVLILGTGGTSRTAEFVARTLGAAQVIRVSRGKKAQAVTYADAIKLHRDADAIINTTPVGMFPAPFAVPIDVSLFSNLSLVIDAVYNPLRSMLVQSAEQRFVKASGGLYMLVAQAAKTNELFFKRTVPEDMINRVYRELWDSKNNIVLIGMPGSGKSTVGRQLAQITGRFFTDTDLLIEQKTNRSISGLFAEKGERAFRSLETEMIREISKKTGQIIATGGGAVLLPENVAALKSNGRLVFLDRDLEFLSPSKDRPLASTKEAVSALYRQRLELYRSVADYVAPGNDAAEIIANRIAEGFAL